jgi:hypothetical protein
LAGRQAEQEETFDELPSKSSSILNTSVGAKRKQSADLRRLLTQRRSLKLLLEDAVSVQTDTAKGLIF